MNRTIVFLGLAAALLLVAVVVGLPRHAVTVTPPAPPPVPIVVVKPVDPPVVPPPPSAHPGSLTLTGKLSHPYLVPGTSDVFATLDVSAVDVPGSKRAPVNLVLVIDRSGSMSGVKLANAKQAALRLVDMLDENDRLAVVHFGNDVRTVGGLQATPENREKMRRAITNIWDEGGTNIGDALMAGKAQLLAAGGEFKVNRLLLLSDGQPTVGITSAAGLVKVVSRIRDAGISVTALGVGADFNEDLMQRFADVGGGSYAFISSGASMVSIFEKDLKQAGTMVARGVSLTFTLPDGMTFREVFGRPTSQNGRQVTVTLPDFSASQDEKVVVHLTATTSAAANTAVDVADFKLAYHDLLTDKEADSALKLAAMLTNDSTLAAAKRDGEAFVTATRARASVNYQKAAVLMEKGDFRQATETLKQNDQLFDDAAVVGGATAVAADKQQNSYYFGLSNSAPAAAPEVQRERVKSLKVQSLRGSGRGESVY